MRRPSSPGGRTTSSRSPSTSRPTSGRGRTAEADAPVPGGAPQARSELFHQLAGVRCARRDQAPAHVPQPPARDVLPSAMLWPPRRTRLLTASPGGARSGLRTARASERLACLRLLDLRLLLRLLLPFGDDPDGPAAGC